MLPNTIGCPTTKFVVLLQVIMFVEVVVAVTITVGEFNITVWADEYAAVDCCTYIVPLPAVNVTIGPPYVNEILSCVELAIALT